MPRSVPLYCSLCLRTTPSYLCDLFKDYIPVWQGFSGRSSGSKEVSDAALFQEHLVQTMTVPLCMSVTLQKLYLFFLRLDL